MTKNLTLEEILKLNPHLDEDEIRRMLDQLRASPSPQQPRRTLAPDRLRVGDVARPRKVKLRF
jgi:hypothetical protein